MYQDAHMLPSSPLDVTTVHKSEALKRLVKEKKEKSVKGGEKTGKTSEASPYLFHLLLRQMQFRLTVLAARINPETLFMWFSLAAVGP